MSKLSQRHHFSNFIYGGLPFLYIGVGLLTAFALRNVMAYVSGLSLVLAGSMTWYMREKYRRAFNASRGYIDVLSWTEDAHPVSGDVQIPWRSSYECGHPVLDAQHRRLFGLCSELVNAVVNRLTRKEVELLITRVFDHLGEHFATEEQARADARRKLSAKHQNDHKTMLETAASLRARYQRGESVERELIGFVTYDVIIEHIANESTMFTAKPKKRVSTSDAHRDGAAEQRAGATTESYDAEDNVHTVPLEDIPPRNATDPNVKALSS